MNLTLCSVDISQTRGICRYFCSMYLTLPEGLLLPESVDNSYETYHGTLNVPQMKDIEQSKLITKDFKRY